MSKDIQRLAEIRKDIEGFDGDLTRFWKDWRRFQIKKKPEVRRQEAEISGQRSAYSVQERAKIFKVNILNPLIV
jgi:hypothetical protein